VARRRPGACARRRGRNRFGEPGREERPREPAEREEEREDGTARQDRREHTALDALPRGPHRFFLDQLAPDVEQPPYSTPDGQVVSQARQVRQRSRCKRVLSLISCPSSACFTR